MTESLILTICLSIRRRMHNLQPKTNQSRTQLIMCR